MDKREGKLPLDLEEVHNLKCLMDKPTWVTPTSQTLIDVLLTSNPEYFRSSGIINHGLRDHTMIYGIMNNMVKNYPSKILSCRNYVKLDEEGFGNNPVTAAWHVMDIFESLEEKCDYWHSLLNYVIDEHIPVKKKHVGTQDVPYVTKNWKKAIRDKRKAAKAHANNRIEENGEMKRKTRNAATKQRRIAINKFLKVKSEELNSNLNTGILQNFQTSSGEGKWILWL